MVLRQRRASVNSWPILETSSTPPDAWSGWPEGKRFALVLTHDVDTARGQERCRELMKLEMQLGFRSSFNFVPERYAVSSELRHALTQNGFEVGVHGLNHDGKYFTSKKEFKKRANKINQYLNAWQSVGYRSPSMQHNLEWFHDLNIEYDASTFDTDPFEPQPEGVKTIFPFVVHRDVSQRPYVELPYTLPQDFTLFILMKEKTVDIWKRKLEWVAENGGMVLMNTHPDYMNFQGEKLGLEEYPAEYYRELLSIVKSQYAGRYWHALPKEVSRFWYERNRAADGQAKQRMF